MKNNNKKDLQPKALLVLENNASIQPASPLDVDYIFVTEFNDSAVADFYKKYITLSSRPEVKIIPVVVSSFGGQVHSLLAMLDIMESSTKPVATIGLGKAMSCGSVLLAAGTPGYRFVAPNTDIMIHEVSSVNWGKNTDIQNDAVQTKKLNDKLLKLYAKYANHNDAKFFLKQLHAKSNVDWWITPKEFVKYGLADHIQVPQLVKK